MFFELTDLLSCPRCGTAHGLVLLVQDVNERRVRNGWLGCPNCRHDYPVSDGVADLRLDTNATRPRREPLRDGELPLKILALSGLAGQKAVLLVDERLAHAANGIVSIAPDLEVIVLLTSPEEPRLENRISRLVTGGTIPLVEYRLPGVAIAPGGDSELVAAAARRVAAGGRLVLFDARETDVGAAKEAGLTLVAVEGGTAVAERKVERAFQSR